MTPTEKPITIPEAAKEIGMNRHRLREVCIQGGIAIPWGGKPDHPFVKVILSEARRLVLSQRVMPKGGKKPKRHVPMPAGVKLHRHVTC